MRGPRTTGRRRGQAPDWLTPKGLAREIRGWILDGEMRQLSPLTVRNRETVTGRLLAYLAAEGCDTCGPAEIRGFLASLSGYGSGDRAVRERPLQPSTARLYFNVLGGLFHFLVEDGTAEASPMERLKAPVVRQDQVQPYTAEELVRLLEAARRGQQPYRNVALLLLLVDTGLRASEVCSLRLGDVDFDTRRFTVRGKGNKARQVFFGTRTARALWAWIDPEERKAHPERALFPVTRGQRVGQPMNRHNLLGLIQTMGERAGVKGANVHRCRHSFAVEFLRGGGNIYGLQALMGHQDLEVLRRYLAFTQADLEQQHRAASPVDRLLTRPR